MMEQQFSRYSARGVSSSKNEVHAAVKKIDKGLFAGAFCKIVPDHFGNDPAYCTFIHADGAGTKPALAYLYWKETGNTGVWKGIAQDALVMNLDDLLCIGSTGPFLVSSCIARNKFRIPAEVLEAVISGTEEFCNLMKTSGIELLFGGGETADAGDILQTISVDSVFSGRMKRNEIIQASGMRPGDVIVALESGGKASYESHYNSGIGCNGLTAARHELLHHDYAVRYPETFDSQIDPALVYSGNIRLTDTVAGIPLSAGEALLSPTRTYAPVMKEILAAHRGDIHSIIHCTGGGQTKVLHFAGNLRIIKDDLFDTPAIFTTIAAQNGFPAEELYRVFNMGHRMEIYTHAEAAENIISISARHGIRAKIAGRCEPCDKPQLVIETAGHTLTYSAP